MRLCVLSLTDARERGRAGPAADDVSCGLRNESGCAAQLGLMKSPLEPQVICSESGAPAGAMKALLSRTQKGFTILRR